MQLRKKKTPEEVRRREGVNTFLRKVGKGFKQLGTEYVTPAAKVGRGLINACQGKDLGLIQEELITGVMSGVMGGKPGGLPAGAVGTGMTRKQALHSLGTSAVKISKEESTKRGYSTKIHPHKVRRIADAVRKTPPKVLKPITNVEFKTGLGKGTRGQNVRDVDRTSEIQIAPGAKAESLHHEGGHGYSWGIRGDRSLPGYYADVLETASKKGSKLVKREKAAGRIAEGRSFYRDKPIETHARNMAAVLDLPFYKKGVSSKEYDKIFVDQAKATTRKLKEESPTLYKQTLHDVASRYRKRARIVKRTESGKLPETFDEWLSGVEKMPKSKVVKKTKKLTPGEIARALQDAAEKKGPPMYLRRKASAAPLPKDISTVKTGKKRYKIIRKAD